jgi:hypothetical protein
MREGFHVWDSGFVEGDVHATCNAIRGRIEDEPCGGVEGISYEDVFEGFVAELGS